MQVLVVEVNGTYGGVDQPTIFLRARAWDDYGYRTEFDAAFARPLQPLQQLGIVKILARHYPAHSDGLKAGTDNWTVGLLYAVSDGLDSNEFCSLGQSDEYYRRVAQIDQPERSQILVALCDITLEPVPLNPWWRTAEGFNLSILRQTTANRARLNAAALLRGESLQADSVAGLRYTKVDGGILGGPDVLELRFDGQLTIPGRLNVVVGRNGVGKTSVLSGIARWFDRSIPKDKWNYRPEFSCVLILSHNPFDDELKLSDPLAGNVRYIGEFNRPMPSKLQKLVEALWLTGSPPPPLEWSATLAEVFKTPSDLLAAVAPQSWANMKSDSFTELAAVPEWQKFLQEALDDQDLIDLLLKRPANARDELSAGQRSIICIWASLFLNLAPQALLLIDEPENFLHPSWIARFVRSLNILLELRKSFAIAATHSPILVQETPARFVSILEREGDITTQRQPPFETFGESTDNLTGAHPQADLQFEINNLASTPSRCEA